MTQVESQAAQLIRSGRKAARSIPLERQAAELTLSANPRRTRYSLLSDHHSEPTCVMELMRCGAREEHRPARLFPAGQQILVPFTGRAVPRSGPLFAIRTHLSTL